MDRINRMEGVIIRPWTEADFPAIRQLSAAEGWHTAVERPDEALAAWRHSQVALVAAAGREVAGFLRALSDSAVTTYVAEILVAPGWRGRGIGRALLEACHRQVPATRLDLLSTGQAHGFYEAEGFRSFRGYRKTRREPCEG